MLPLLLYSIPICQYAVMWAWHSITPGQTLRELAHRHSFSKDATLVRHRQDDLSQIHPDRPSPTQFSSPWTREHAR